METSSSITKLAEAFTKFQTQAISAKKANTNPHFKNKYAGVNEVLAAVLGPLTENGLSVLQFPDGEHGLTTRLQHTSGEYMQATYPMKPSQATPQGVGSAMTYARRYALVSILGLGAEDDDGNAGSAPAPAAPAAAPAPPKQATDAQRNELRQLLNELDTSGANAKRDSHRSMLMTMDGDRLDQCLVHYRKQLKRLHETGEVPQ